MGVESKYSPFTFLSGVIISSRNERSLSIDFKLSSYKSWSSVLLEMLSLPEQLPQDLHIKSTWLERRFHHAACWGWLEEFSEYSVAFLPFENVCLQVLQERDIFEFLFVAYILLMPADASKIPQLK